VRVADVGDVDVNPLDILDTYSRIETTVSLILDRRVIPICVGGDHSISLPVLRAMARRHGPLGMVHIDAHQDMWDEYFGNRYFHGTTFRRAIEENLLDTSRVVQIGIRGSVYSNHDFDFARKHGVRMVRAEELDRRGMAWVAEQVGEIRGGPTYLSFDIDAVDPAYAPGTGTPEVGGLTSREALLLIRALLGHDIVGADLVEVSPPYDQGGITSLLAANILFETISVIAATRAHSVTHATEGSLTSSADSSDCKTNRVPG